jgi:alanine racemase
VRPTRAEIDLDAIRHNVTVLRELVAPSALLVVVKADGYGHGAVEVARAALDAGADALGVALVEEGVQLRTAGVTGRIVVLSEQHSSSLDDLVAHGLAATVYTEAGVASLADAASRAGSTVEAHLKVDTGMHRVGAHPDDALARARAIASASNVRLAAAFTHFPVADQPEDPYTDGQLARFAEVLDALAAEGLRPERVHAANSAGAIAHPGSRFDLVRCGIAVYGVAPGPRLAGAVDVRPAMRLVSEVSFVKTVGAGTRVSYGLAYETSGPAVLATVPIGYADGVPRRLGGVGGEVLIGGQRCRIAGNVTMDQIVVDCGPDADVVVGAEVVLLGRQGDEEVRAEEWADRLGTIGYEIVTRIGPRVPRIYAAAR